MGKLEGFAKGLENLNKKLVDKEAEIAERKASGGKAPSKEERKQAKEERKEEKLASFGKCVLDTMFDTYRVRLFDKGFIQIDSFAIPSEPQKLLKIEAEANITRKGAFGRSAGAIAGTLVGAGPLNMLSPSNRGDLHIVIVTDEETHTLRTAYTTKDNVNALHEIETRGKALIESLSPATKNVETKVSLGLSEELEKLASLKEQGLLSDEEFAAAKAKLISG
jgi:hypothetical protein